MKMKAGYGQDLIAKIDYIQSIDVDLAAGDNRFLDALKSKLGNQTYELSRQERARVESILEMDTTRSVYRITSGDHTFARLPPVTDSVPKPPTISNLDPFAAIGKKAKLTKPKSSGGKVRRKKRARSPSGQIVTAVQA